MLPLSAWLLCILEQGSLNRLFEAPWDKQGQEREENFKAAKQTREKGHD